MSVKAYRSTIRSLVTLCALLACWLASPAARAQAQSEFTNFVGVGPIGNPTLQIVYWDQDTNNWNNDVVSNNFPTATRDRLDAVMFALVHSWYYNELWEYNVQTPLALAPSIMMGDVCPSFGLPPSDTGSAAGLLGAPTGSSEAANAVYVTVDGPAMGCLRKALISRGQDPGATILIILYPPSVQGNGGNGFCQNWGAYHKAAVPKGSFPPTETVMPYAVVPFACNNDLQDALYAITHESVEAITDPVFGEGWIDNGVLIDGVSYANDEIADICQGPDMGFGESGPASEIKSQNFMQALVPGGTIANYWSNALGLCENGCNDKGGNPPAPPIPDSQFGSVPIQLCGRGTQMGTYLSFTSLHEAVMPLWDVPIGPMCPTSGPNTTGQYCNSCDVHQQCSNLPSGPQSLYLSAKISTTDRVVKLQAGNPLRFPVRDTVGFQAITYQTGCDPSCVMDCGCSTSITIAGFHENVSIAAGDTVSFTFIDPNTGLDTTVSAPAPQAASVSCAVSSDPGAPIPGWIMFAGGATVEAQVTDSCDFFYPWAMDGNATPLAPGPIEGDTVTGGTIAAGSLSDPTDFSAMPFAPQKSDPFGNVSWPLVTETAGQIIVGATDTLTLNDPNSAISCPLLIVDVHPKVSGIQPVEASLGQTTTITVQGQGFAGPAQGPRTTVTVGNFPCENVVVAAGGTSLTCTAPASSTAHTAAVVVSVDAVPSLPLTLFYGVTPPPGACAAADSGAAKEPRCDAAVGLAAIALASVIARRSSRRRTRRS